MLGAEEAADALSSGFDRGGAAKREEEVSEGAKAGGALDEERKEELLPEAEVAPVRFVPGGGVAGGV